MQEIIDSLNSGVTNTVRKTQWNGLNLNMGWDFHSLSDAQNQRSRDLPGFLPGAPDPDRSFHISLPNPGNQVWQPALPLPGSLPPGLEYLSQVFLSLYFYTRSPLKMNTDLVSCFSTKVEGLQQTTYWSEKSTVNHEIMIKKSLLFGKKLVLFYSHFYFPYLFGRVWH